MIITYHGHATFKLKGKRGTVVTDPYDDFIGLTLPRLSADIITVSHDHKDHNAADKVSGTARRNNPFVVDKPGEYEVGRISVFGVPTFHDDSRGSERGANTVFTILIDHLRVCHLGDLGHDLTSSQVEKIGAIDILLCPVGGEFTINSEQAVKIIRTLEPGIVIPMHFKTPAHNTDVFSGMTTLQDFTREYGLDPAPMVKLEIGPGKIPEETQLILLEQT